MRYFVVAWIFAAAAVVPTADGSTHARQEENPDARQKPNILLIMADDFGAECVGAYGGKSYDTPNMDRLAAGGIRFTNAFTCPLCTPTRVQLMSGQYPFRNGWPGGIWNGERAEQVVDPDRLVLGSVMRRAGYKTAVAGKWQLARFDDHPDHAARCGFDAHCLWTWKYDSGGESKPSRYWDPGVWQDGHLRKDTKGKFGPDLYCDGLIEFMRKHRDEPFFLYYPMALVHFPLVRPPGSEATGEQEQFAAMVAYADKLIGRLLGALDDLGLREKTLVIVTGDNGTPGRIISRLGDRDIPGGKTEMTEAGTRVPFIANWPGTVAAGGVCDDLVDTSDVLPTLTELAGTELPEDRVFDGRGFGPQLRGESGRPREWVYVQKYDEWYLRGRKYRLNNEGALYDMSDRYAAKRLTEPLSDEAAAAQERLKTVVEELRGSVND